MITNPCALKVEIIIKAKLGLNMEWDVQNHLSARRSGVYYFVAMLYSVSLSLKKSLLSPLILLSISEMKRDLMLLWVMLCSMLRLTLSMSVYYAV